MALNTPKTEPTLADINAQFNERNQLIISTDFFKFRIEFIVAKNVRISDFQTINRIRVAFLHSLLIAQCPWEIQGLMFRFCHTKDGKKIGNVWYEDEE